MAILEKVQITLVESSGDLASFLIAVSSTLSTLGTCSGIKHHEVQKELDKNI